MLVRCPECGLMDYILFRVEMHKAVIYQCQCGHSWKKYYPPEKWIPQEEEAPYERRYRERTEGK